MKIEKEYLMAVFGIFVFLIAGIVVLNYFGVSHVFYFVVMLIITGLIIAVYYVWKTTTEKKNVLWLKASKEKTANEIKEIYLNALKNLDKISSQFPEMDINSEKEMMNNVNMTMISLGCFTVKYDLIYPKLEKLNLSYLVQKKRDIEEEINKIDKNLISKFQKYISEYYKNLNKIIEECKNVGLKLENFEFDENVKNVNDAIEKMIYLKNKFYLIYDSVYSQVSELESIAGSRYNTSIQKEKILSATKDFYGLSTLIVVKHELNDTLFNDVLKLKNAVFNVDANNLKDENILNDDEKQELISIMNAVKNMNEYTIKDIETVEKKYKEILKNAIKKIRENIISSQNFINQQELPEELVSKYNKINLENFNIEVPDNLPIDIFANKCLENIKKMNEIFEKKDTIRRIIKNYPVIKSLIEKRIQEKGSVSPGDLKVNHAEEFLIYYRFKNPDKADKVKI